MSQAIEINESTAARKMVGHSQPNGSVETGDKKRSSRFGAKVIGLLVLLLLVGFAARLAYTSYLFVSTDDATVEGRAILIAAKVGGVIVKSSAFENQKVKKGQVLAEIRDDDFQNAVVEAQAHLDSLKAQLKGTDSNYRRTLELFRGNAYSREKLDLAEAQYRSMVSQVKAAESAFEQAKINLEYTKIVAPADGQLGRKSFEVGTLAAPGTPLVGFVYSDERWVVANLKETDMHLIREGKKAQVEVDAIPDRVFEGEVESISPNTGATFSMLPPDNATGNFTKVVQRVPVRIKLTSLTKDDIDRLQTGLSVEVSIKVH